MHSHLHAAEHFNGVDDLQVATAGQPGIMSADQAGRVADLPAPGVGVLPLTGGTLTGPLVISDATASISTDTGALIVTGGVGIGGALNVGGGFTVAGITYLGATNPLFVGPDGQVSVQNTNTFIGWGNLLSALNVVADVEILGGLYVSGGINPEPKASNPGGSATLWVNSADGDKLYFGASKVGDQDLSGYALLSGATFTGDVLMSGANLWAENITTGNGSYLELGFASTMAVSTAGKARLYYDTEDNALLISQNAGAYVPVIQDLSGYALLSGATFTGSISATNLSGTNTGDQDLSGYALLSGAVFTGNVTVQGMLTGASGLELFNGANKVVDIESSATLLGFRLNNGSFAINDGYADLNFAVRKVGSGSAIVYDAGLDTLTIGSPTTFSSTISATNLSGTNTGDQDLSGKQDILSEGAFIDGDKTKLDGAVTSDVGTWTPAFTGIGTGTYAVQVGTYIKIGELVVCQFFLDVDAVGTASGDLVISGLPFTSSSVTNAFFTSSQLYGNEWATPRPGSVARLGPSSTTMTIFHGCPATAVGIASHADLDVGNLIGTITYFVD